MLRVRMVSVACVLVTVVASCVLGDTAAVAKTAKSCKILKPAKMSDVLDAEVSKANGAGTGGYACSFDIGAGLGEAGGGLVVVTVYDAALGKGILASAKKTAEDIPGSKAIWDTNAQGALVAKHGKVVVVSVSYTNDTPAADDLRAEMAELATLASKKL